ncbi:MAG: DUF6588 family protein, partial [Elusimicrobiota bacterium]|nr:DUF6588 family protein [Elusimicrobiota bacterium]
MTRTRAALLALALGSPTASAAANPSLGQDFRGMTQWLSHELAQGLAFNAGSNFDPPHEVKGYALQPDLSLGVGRMPLNKRDFPSITVPALNDFGGQNLFPDSVVFPNLALHLRMGLPWRGDVYFRFADATTPSNYKISRTMTAAVQTNSYGIGVRQHLFGREEQPTLTLGAHYNHVKGRVRLKSRFQVNVDTNFTADSDLDGALDWNLNSYGLTAIVHKAYGAWTPFGGVGYNYATGSARARLELKSQTDLIPDVVAEGSSRPEQSQGRWIFGVEYNKPTWSVFANAEFKALGRLQYRSFIAQIGVALP